MLLLSFVACIFYLPVVCCACLHACAQSKVHKDILCKLQGPWREKRVCSDPHGWWQVIAWGFNVCYQDVLSRQPQLTRTMNAASKKIMEITNLLKLPDHKCLAFQFKHLCLGCSRHVYIQCTSPRNIARHTQYANPNMTLPACCSP